MFLRRFKKNAPADADLGQEPSLKKRAFRGSMWTFINYGAAQVIRLASNLILARLLSPNDFGLMALVFSFLVGLAMFSDLGIAPSIIQNKRGEEPEFLNTAWTLQVIRGSGLWICSCLIAVPVAWFYKEPLLAQMLPVVGLTSLLDGLNSTKLYTANRKLMLGRLTLMDLTGQILALVLMISLAWFYHSVWALVIGSVFSSLLRNLFSHFLLEGMSNRFHWNQEAWKELHRFGRWIFLSSIMGFLASQGDRLVIGRLMDVRFLGVYSIALTFSLLPSEIIRKLVNQVLFPSYSELIRDRPERLYPVLRKSRLVVLGMGWGGALIFLFFGQAIIKVLYKKDYSDAGWMLQILSVGAMGLILRLSYDGILLAHGKSLAQSFVLGAETVMKFAGMILGYYFARQFGEAAGQHGVVLGLVIATWLTYPLEVILFYRLRLWQPEIDLPLIAGTGALLTGLFYAGIFRLS